MITWTLIIWVLHHQLALPGYANEADCTKARNMAKLETAREVVVLYCIPGPAK